MHSSRLPSVRPTRLTALTTPQMPGAFETPEGGDASSAAAAAARVAATQAQTDLALQVNSPAHYHAGAYSVCRSVVGGGRSVSCGGGVVGVLPPEDLWNGVARKG